MTYGRGVVAALTAVLAVTLVVMEYDAPGYSVPRVLLIAAVGSIMVAVGLLAGASGDRRIGRLVALAGILWFVERVAQAVGEQWATGIAALVAGLWAIVILHAIVAFPSGRLSSAVDRMAIVGFYVLQIGTQVVIILVIPRWEPRGGAGPNDLALFPDADLADRVAKVTDSAQLVFLVAVLAILVGRWVRATPPVRRAYQFVWLGGVAFCANVVLLVSAGLGVVTFDQAYGLWLECVAGFVPITMAASLLTTRVTEDRLVHLVVDLETGDRGERLRASLRRALDDPSLDLVYRRPGTDDWIDGEGRSADVVPEAMTDGRVATPVDFQGRSIAAILHDPVLLRSRDRLATATAAAGLAIDNERLQAELRARLADVQASRARIVEAGDRERQRVERNLHDGAQQRLVALRLTLQLAQRRAGGDPDLGALLDEATRELDASLAELRELARGIHPAIVTEAGLPAALASLAERPGTPVELDLDLPARLPEPVEVGAYYVAAEALANANKHAGAQRIKVLATLSDGDLLLVVSDDGRGGAEARPGSGLEGLTDRVGALGGRLDVASPEGVGTTLTVLLPLGSEAPATLVRPAEKVAP